MVKILCLLLVALMVAMMLCGCSNQQLFDVTFSFEYGYVKLPNGEVVEGRVTSWKDYADSDVVQVVIDGKTYLTHYSNVVLASD